MKKREDIVQKFSTFLSFGSPISGRNPIWQADPELERPMKRLTQSEPEAKEEFWARYFLKISREVSQVGSEGISSSQPLTQNSEISSLRAGRHLSAYFQDACLWAAQKTYQRFKFLRHRYPLEEYFQIANSAANPPAKLLKNFNFHHPKTNIEGYAKTAIVRFIQNTIYHHDLEAKRDKFSDYGLLKDLTTKELKEALVLKGINHGNLNSYCLAWKCFDEIYQPNTYQGSRSLPSPNQEQLEQMASYYNQQRDRLDLSAAPASAEKIQEMLSICIQAARDRRTQRFLPLEDYGHLSDSTPTPWDTLMQEEALEQVQLLVSRLFSTLPELGQTMLKLWQGLNLTQSEMASVLKSKYPELQKQYQVARQLGRYTKTLLKDFTNEWNKIEPEICINDDKDIERIKDALSECLQSYYQQSFNFTLDRIEEQWSDEEKKLIVGDRLNSNNPIPDEQTPLPASELANGLGKVKQRLIKPFKYELEKSMKLTHNSLDLVNDKIVKFIDGWLKNKQAR